MDLALTRRFDFQYNFCMAFACASPDSQVHGVEGATQAEVMEQPQKLIVSFISFCFYVFFQAHLADVAW